MGRKRSRPSDDKKHGGMNTTDDEEKTIESALGHTGQVCQDCNANNPDDADKCRRCNRTNLRDKASEYRDA